MSLLDADRFGGNWIFRFNQTLNFPLKFSSTMQNGACSSLVMAWVKMHKLGKSHLFPGNIRLPSYIKIVENLKAQSIDHLKFLRENGLFTMHASRYEGDNFVKNLATIHEGYEALAYENHAIGLAVTAQGVDCFDPNFGCVHFPTRQNFITWFQESYWPNRWGIGTMVRPCNSILVFQLYQSRSHDRA
ncbi:MULTISPECIES: YopT-type cysteine protease domain-containing protein [Xenorhabdus]|uniref:Plasmid type III secretion system effector protein n=1 Tax=Xenorhabdus ehlersii TaxID=290111 RepID=A0A2D0IMX4_9GAMM|nr:MULTISPECIES: YopT-type cysteine protease domain-containing protein [Xenorhabdus]MBC8951198.1 plasmid type III secretion system effector protein [Xenorhabdus sp. TS4]PHM23183.1 plasmid type III secretion system effector protein [Xenorhabdus ehlersii]RKE89290.1 YopT peptidase [Xenorhabdus ehlersii]